MCGRQYFSHAQYPARLTTGSSMPKPPLCIVAQGGDHFPPVGALTLPCLWLGSTQSNGAGSLSLPDRDQLTRSHHSCRAPSNSPISSATPPQVTREENLGYTHISSGQWCGGHDRTSLLAGTTPLRPGGHDFGFPWMGGISFPCASMQMKAC